MSATRNASARIEALAEWLDENGEILDFLHINRSEILAEAGPIAPGFQFDYVGGTDRNIRRLTVARNAAVAYRDRHFPVQGPKAPAPVVVDDGWPF